MEKVSCFPNEGTPEVLPGPIADGDIVREGTAYFRYKAPREIIPAPRVLSKTAFQDYAITQLGNGLTGMARFTTIMDATRDSTNAAVRFAFSRYEAAQTFEKENTATLTAVMAADSTTGHLTDAERAAILDNWPVG